MLANSSIPICMPYRYILLSSLEITPVSSRYFVMISAILSISEFSQTPQCLRHLRLMVNKYTTTVCHPNRYEHCKTCYYRCSVKTLYFFYHSIHYARLLSLFVLSYRLQPSFSVSCNNSVSSCHFSPYIGLTPRKRCYH